MEENRRPSPEEMLVKLQAEEEMERRREFGRLNIFLGYAAGTGKTYALPVPAA